MEKPQDGELLKSRTVIITEPNGFAAQIHDRMPAFLTEAQFAPCVSGQAGAGILKPGPNVYLQRWPVSKRSIALIIRRQIADVSDYLSRQTCP